MQMQSVDLRPSMIHAVSERFDVTEQHRAGAASTELVPRAMHVEVFLGGFLALGDGAADFLSRGFRTSHRVDSEVRVRLMQVFFPGGEQRRITQARRCKFFTPFCTI